ncbi:PREDICTED: ficolin-2-like isoform X2 [Rhagoletis zephyria]|uniref:ficolin-2-like isoform X1 n=1 Tax=Rhagoletis zephyria TaxID=28612 RepID=UPI0008116B4B|nr:PREDICTED: ficolin-2-like isoform X1 [Rhagoletis zephyria]XP_017478807.1 PREDICTED: ficolin-2-like isoform X2 [Rhagoletis zephyria]
MWLRFVFLTAALLHLSGLSSAFTTGMQGWGNVIEVSNEGALNKFLCGVNYENCYGQKLSTEVSVSNDKIYKLEVYEIKPPATLKELLDEQNNLVAAMHRLEDKVQAQGADVRNDLEAAEYKLREQNIDISEIKQDGRSLRSEIEENLGQQKTALLKILNTKLTRLRQKIGKPAAEDPNAGLPASCAEAFEKYDSPESGIFTLYLPDFDLPPFEVYCLADPNGGPAWTVVQRRTDGTEDFYRNWDDYVAGFGDKENEFFIGLEKLYALTNDQPNELWIKLEDFEEDERYAKYAEFAIGDESENYALNVLEGFSGDAGDSMITQKGQKFTTKDRDNDKHTSYNCAVTFKGAWWYNRCHDSNLNGRYLFGEYSYFEEAEGIDWYTWHGHEYSLKYVHMAIRPKNS